MTKRLISDEEFERQYEAVKRAQRKPELQAIIARYDSDTHQLIVELKNGSTIRTPISWLPEFENASPSDIAEVELSSRGEALHWEKLDQDFSVGGLILTVFGNKRFMAELGRVGGSATSEAKAAAARKNGRKGGRPPQVRAMAASAAASVRATVLQSDEDLIAANVAGGAHQTTASLAIYETALAKAQRAVARTISDVPQGQALGEKSDYLEPAITSFSGHNLEEADEYADFPVAA